MRSAARGGCLVSQVRVQVGCDAQLGMPEQHRHLNERDAGGDQLAGGRVPQVVKPDGLECSGVVAARSA